MRCGRCGDVIGFYEPLVLLGDHQARTTSAAAEPHIAEEPGKLLHRACYSKSQHEAVAPGPNCYVVSPSEKRALLG